jgi:hypothetical protein
LHHPHEEAKRDPQEQPMLGITNILMSAAGFPTSVAENTDESSPEFGATNDFGRVL